MLVSRLSSNIVGGVGCAVCGVGCAERMSGVHGTRWGVGVCVVRSGVYGGGCGGSGVYGVGCVSVI